MQHERETLCKYRLERAKEDLQAAHVNHESGLFKAAINRSYYAIFHSIRAVNILDGFDASKHRPGSLTAGQCRDFPCVLMECPGFRVRENGRRQEQLQWLAP